jgi:putative membrane protein
MANPVDGLFSPDERNRITAAVREAELQTSGEIVPYVVERSDQYEEAEWRAGVMCGALTFAGLTVVRSLAAAWVPLDVMELGLSTLAAGACGMLLVRIMPPLRRLFAGRQLLARRVEQRAAEAFISEEVFNTKGRTGILIFVSLFERRVLVVGDSGINAKVKKEEWDGVVQHVVAGIVAGKPADGLVDAIADCGVLLRKQGVARGKDDRDELSDALRVGKD